MGFGYFDGDDLPEVAVLSQAELDWVSWASEAITTIIPSNPWGYKPDVAVADFDFDGDSDIYAPESDSYLMCYGNGTFVEAAYPGDDALHLEWQLSLAGPLQNDGLGDLNGDGHADLLYLDGEDLYIALSVGSFVWDSALLLSPDVTAFEAGDIDEDGDLDIVVLTTANTVASLVNDGTGTYTSVSVLVTTGVSGDDDDVVLIDYYGRGALDVLVATVVRDENEYYWLELTLFDGSGQANDTWVVDMPAYAIMHGQWRDFDNDGRKDFVFVGYSAVGIVSGGEFDAGATTLWTEHGYEPYFILVSDFDADGDLDIATDSLNRDLHFFTSDASCSDGVLSGDETCIDGGGSCGATCEAEETCIADSDCVDGYCDDNTGACASCFDGALNGDETCIDGGGSCGAVCDAGETCAFDTDCADGECEPVTGECASCFDGVLNLNETCVDGGSHCGATCEPGEVCLFDTDCTNADCEPTTGECAACDDGVLNGNETCIDGGGIYCGATCEAGETCDFNTDCANAECESTTGACASCFDGILNLDETCIDGGGSCGAVCDAGETCAFDTDCADGECEPATGECASCFDGVLNLNETCVDGGSHCGATCEPGEVCLFDTDCANADCEPTTGECAACDDGVLNGNETCVDGGGNVCGAVCEPGEMCAADTDCSNADCEPTTGECATCDDGVLNGNETCVDGGGNVCGAVCEPGETCALNSDCDNDECDQSTGACASCFDGALNLNETCVDGGGLCGATCDAGETCALDTDCANGECEPATGECASCFDGVLNLDETCIDGGGSCGAVCEPGELCLFDTDCANIDCEPTTGECATCDDGALNGNETCIDGGGNVCGAVCEPGETCLFDTDCANADCEATTGECATCFDGAMNANETCVDGGGNVCGAACEPGETCALNSDCNNDECDQSTGACASCFDGALNLNETCIDGGGLCGANCEAGETCALDTDCVDGECEPATGECASCFDGVLNLDETCIDGGGSCGAVCEPGEVCLFDTDCANAACEPATGECAACDDGVLNGNETCVDGGGNVCGAVCEPGETCAADTDCSNYDCEPTTGECAACDDGVLNANETCVDGGGNVCGAVCEPGETCALNSDCDNDECDQSTGACASCFDGALNLDESCIDGGGLCGANCEPGETCALDTDCADGECEPATGECASCFDGALNLDETCIDGGGSCGAVCEPGESCAFDTDCADGECEPATGACASCFDEVLNLNETCVDGGGSCGATCQAGETCVFDTDCGNYDCEPTTGECAACDDGVLNGNETCIDGGGYFCGAVCEPGETCDFDTDCANSDCEPATGECAACDDGVQNGNETCVDGGGYLCGATCEAGESCAVDRDCYNDDCEPLTAECASCNDTVRNLNETDVDCGGNLCIACAAGQTCDVAADCASDYCVNGVCTEPSVPDTVSVVTAEAGDRVVNVSWSEPNDNGRTITQYVIAFDDFWVVSNGSYQHAVVPDVNNGVTYQIAVIAVNALGESAPSTAVTATPMGSVLVELEAILLIVGDGVTLTFTMSSPPHADVGVEVTSSIASYADFSPSNQLWFTENTTSGSLTVTSLGALEWDVQVAMVGTAAAGFELSSTTLAVQALCGGLLDGVLCDGCVPQYFDATLANDDDAATPQCEDCPDNAECVGGSEVPVPDPGYFSTVPGIVESCLPAEACEGGFGRGTCAVGYEGDLCKSCTVGSYYRSGSVCAKCPNNVAMVIVVFLAVSVVLLWAGFKLVSTQKELLDAVKPALNITVDYMQLLSVLASYTLWPPSVKSTVTVISVFSLNLQLLGTECAGVSYAMRWLFVIMLPVVCVLVPLGARLASALKQRLRDEAPAWTSNDEQNAQTLKLTLLQLTYLVVTQSTLEIFDCVPKATGGAVLDAEPSLYCVGWSDTPDGVDTSTHAALLGPGILATLLYVVGIPLYFLRLWRRARGYRRMSSKDRALVDTSCMSLFTEFRPGCRWWLVAVMGRKLLIGMAKVMFSYNQAFQLCAITFVIVLSWVAHEKWSPYTSTGSRIGINALESWKLFSMFMVLLAGLMYATATFEEAWKNALLDVVTMTVLVGTTLFLLRAVSVQVRYALTFRSSGLSATSVAEKRLEVEMATHRRSTNRLTGLEQQVEAQAEELQELRAMRKACQHALVTSQGATAAEIRKTLLRLLAGGGDVESGFWPSSRAAGPTTSEGEPGAAAVDTKSADSVAAGPVKDVEPLTTSEGEAGAAAVDTHSADSVAAGPVKDVEPLTTSEGKVEAAEEETVVDAGAADAKRGDSVAADPVKAFEPQTTSDGEVGGAADDAESAGSADAVAPAAIEGEAGGATAPSGVVVQVLTDV